MVSARMFGAMSHEELAWTSRQASYDPDLTIFHVYITTKLDSP
jgi:hypothetical protein